MQPPYPHKPLAPPKRRNTIAAVIVVVVCITMLGGGGLLGYRYYETKKAEQAKQLAESKQRLRLGSSRDATLPLVDNDFQFRLEPAKGWKTLNQQEVAYINADACAGLIYTNKASDSAWLSLFNDRHPGANLMKFVKRLPALANFQGSPGSRPIIKSTTFAGKPAAQLTQTGTISGHPGSLVALAVARGENVLSIVAYGKTADDRGVMQLLRAANSVKLLDGPIVGRPPLALKPAHGVGWRMHKGIVESSATGLRLRSTKWCRAAGGAWASGNISNVEVGLNCAEPGLTMSVTPWQQSTADSAWLAEVAANAVYGYEQAAEPLSVRYKDVDVPLYMANGGEDDELLGAAFRVNENLVAQVVLSYAPAARQEVLDALPKLFATIEPMEADSRAKLAAELAKLPPTTRVAAEATYRHGHYIDFKYGVGWDAPPESAWRVRIGDEAAGTLEGVRFWAVEPSLDLEMHMRAVVDPGSDFHNKMVEEQRGALKAPTTEQDALSLGKADAKVTLVHSVTENRNQILVATAIHQGLGYAMVASVPADFGERGLTVARTGLAAFRLGPVARKLMRHSAGWVEEIRQGYRVWLPSGFSKMAENELPVGGSSQWSNGGRTVVVLSMAMGEQANEMTVDIMLQAMVGALARDSTGAIEHSVSEMSGMKAKRIVSPTNLGQIELRQVEYLGVIYVVLAALDKADNRRVFERFEVLKR